VSQLRREKEEAQMEQGLESGAADAESQ